MFSQRKSTNRCLLEEVRKVEELWAKKWKEMFERWRLINQRTNQHRIIEKIEVEKYDLKDGF